MKLAKRGSRLHGRFSHLPRYLQKKGMMDIPMPSFPRGPTSNRKAILSGTRRPTGEDPYGRQPSGSDRRQRPRGGGRSVPDCRRFGRSRLLLSRRNDHRPDPAGIRSVSGGGFQRPGDRNGMDHRVRVSGWGTANLPSDRSAGSGKICRSRYRLPLRKDASCNLSNIRRDGIPPDWRFHRRPLLTAKPAGAESILTWINAVRGGLGQNGGIGVVRSLQTCGEGGGG